MNTTRSLLLALALLLATALPSLYGPPRDANADDGEEVQLLVKCARDEVPHVLAALAPRRVRVYDLATMAELHGPGKTGALPGIPDAHAAWAAFAEAISATREDTARLEVTELAVAPKHLAATLALDGPAAIEGLSEKLATLPYFRSRAARPELGPMARKGERWTARIRVHFGAPGTSDAPPEGRGHVAPLALSEAARASGLELWSVGAERAERNRRTGHGLVSREVTFGPGTLDQLAALLRTLRTTHGLTATEVRWKRHPQDATSGADALPRFVIRVTTRTLPR